MNRYLILVFLIGFSIEASCQKYRLVGDTSRFLCKSDSIEFYFEKNYLEKNKIDTVIELYHHYDNGRYEGEIKAYIWKEKGIVKTKIIMGCDNTEELEIRVIEDLHHVENYFKNKLETTEHILYCASSHDFGYSFTITQGEFKKHGYIRDNRRGVDNFRLESENKIKDLKKEAELNPLIKWLNQIDNQIQEELKRSESDK